MFECVACLLSGVCNLWSVSLQEPLYATPPPSREIGQQGDLLDHAALLVFTYCGFEINWKWRMWGMFSHLTFIPYCFVDINF